MGHFERHVVGSRDHEELRVPAEELEAFNAQIRDRIVVTKAFFGDDYDGFVPEAFGLRGKDAYQQLVALTQTLKYSGMDFVLKVAANHAVIFLNFLSWEGQDFAVDGIDTSARATDRDIGQEAAELPRER